MLDVERFDGGARKNWKRSRQRDDLMAELLADGQMALSRSPRQFEHMQRRSVRRILPVLQRSAVAVAVAIGRGDDEVPAVRVQRDRVAVRQSSCSRGRAPCPRVSCRKSMPLPGVPEVTATSQPPGCSARSWIKPSLLVPCVKRPGEFPGHVVEKENRRDALRGSAVLGVVPEATSVLPPSMKSSVRNPAMSWMRSNL